MRKIIYANKLTQKNLGSLAGRQCMAICIKGYYNKKDARRIANSLCQSSLLGEYVNAKGIYRVGQAYFEGLNSRKDAERYRKNSIDWIRKLRAECAPDLLPIDRVRLELDEAWDYGAHLGNLHYPSRLKAFAGLVRLFKKGGGTEVHLDRLEWDLEAIDHGKTGVMKQFAVNIYLDLPKSGGEVHLWMDALNKKEYEYLRKAGGYGVDESKLRKQDLTFSPQIGDLWLFRASELHKVVDVGDGRRVTQSCFVGYRGDEEHLIIWS